MFNRHLLLHLIILIPGIGLWAWLVWAWGIPFIGIAAEFTGFLLSLSMAQEMRFRQYNWRIIIGWLLFAMGMAVDVLDSSLDHPWAKLTDKLDLEELLLLSGGLMICLAFMRMVTRKRELIAQLQHISRTDPLTSLGNRRAFFEDFTITESMKDPQLVFIDLDKFKQVNDNYGHEVGDQLLIGLSREINEILTGVESAYRLGGDEFVFLLDNPQPEQKIAVLKTGCASAI